MTKKKIFAPAIMLVIFALASVLFAGCFDDDDFGSENAFSVSSDIYFDGEQTISITPSEYGSKTSTFLETITKSDVTVSGPLEGKTVMSVEYISENEIKVTFSGKVKASEPKDSDDTSSIGKIAISRKAIKNGIAGSVYLRVNYHPKMWCDTSNSSASSVSKTYVSEFSLPYGNFITANVNTTNIIVPDDNSTVSVSVTVHGKLRIEVSGFTPYEYNGQTYNYPVAKINANVTTFNKELYVTIGNGIAEYNLV